MTGDTDTDLDRDLRLKMPPVSCLFLWYSTARNRHVFLYGDNLPPFFSTRNENEAREKERERVLCYFLPITKKDVSYCKQVNSKGHRTTLTTIMIQYTIPSVLCPQPVLVPSKATEILLEITADVSDTPSAHCKTWASKKDRDE